jgi:hypothetical protein
MAIGGDKGVRRACDARKMERWTAYPQIAEMAQIEFERIWRIEANATTHPQITQITQIAFE